MSQPCSVCSSPHLREIERRARVGTPAVDIELWLTSQGVGITRHAIGRHLRGGHARGADPKGRGPRTVSTDLLTSIRDMVHEDLAAGELRPTVRDGLSAQQQLDNRSARDSDRELFQRIALAMTGHSLTMARVLDPEIEALEAEYRKLLPSGDDDRDYFAEIDAERLRKAQG